MGVIYCWLYPDFADFEVMVALHRLRNAGGMEIVPLAETLEPVKSQSGLVYLPKEQIDRADPQAEGIILPGGPIRMDQNAVLPLLQAMDEQKKLIAAICFGPQFLARAGILNRHLFTTSCQPEMLEALSVADFFPRQHFRDQRVVRDGHVITAQGPALVDFAAEVCRYFGVYETGEQEYRELWNICDGRKGTQHA